MRWEKAKLETRRIESSDLARARERAIDTSLSPFIHCGQESTASLAKVVLDPCVKVRFEIPTMCCTDYCASSCHVAVLCPVLHSSVCGSANFITADYCLVSRPRVATESADVKFLPDIAA